MAVGRGIDSRRGVGIAGSGVLRNAIVAWVSIGDVEIKAEGLMLLYYMSQWTCC